MVHSARMVNERAKWTISSHSDFSSSMYLVVISTGDHREKA